MPDSWASPLAPLHLPDSDPAFGSRISVTFVLLHAAEPPSQFQALAGRGIRKVMRIQT